MAGRLSSNPLKVQLPFWLGAAFLGAQGLPSLPPMDPSPSLPGQGELLPLRPQVAGKEKDPGVPTRLRGRNVKEDPQGWELEDGALEGQDFLLLADRIRYSTVSGELEAEGNIRLEATGVRLRAARLRMNWKGSLGEAWALELEVAPSWLLKSDKVAFRTWKHWEFDRVELSSCPQDQPGWRAKVGQLKVDLDAYARIRNLWLWVGSIPTFYYLPWAIYPAKAERTSGLLPASVAFSGPNGASFSLPYFQALGSTADVTVAPEWFSRQGILWGGEARWNPELTHQGSFQGQTIKEREGGERRYRFSLKELWQREDGWQFTADVNQASDTLMEVNYGKGIASPAATSFDSAVYLGKNYHWASFSLTSARQQSYFQPDDTLYRADVRSSLRRETLPSFQGRLYPIPLGTFYMDAGFRLSRLAYKLDLGDDRTDVDNAWNRDDFFARVQGRLGQWGPLRADLQTQARFTRYSATLSSDVFNPGPQGEGRSSSDPQALAPFLVTAPGLNRLLGSLRLQLSGPPVGRTFPNFRLFGYEGELKHVLDPFLAFTQGSRSSTEGRLPHFDEVDSQPGVGSSAAGEQSLELGVKQHILGRGGVGTPFADLVRWKISARYHFRPIILPDGRPKEGWASLDNDIDVEPNDKVRISFRRSSEVNAGGADNSLSADIKAQDGSRFNLAYFSTGINRFLVRQQGIQLGGLQRLWDDRLRLEALASYDFRNRLFSNSQVALAYITPCVAASLRYSHVAIRIPLSRTKEDRLDLVFTFRSLGDLIRF